LIEKENRQAKPNEQDILARFPGFGPVALSIFPDPVKGTYKDASWQALGEELKSLLSPEQYDSAKRTTFNAFYTSPIVIQAMHAALKRLGVPETALVLEPGCGSGNFLSYAEDGMRFIGIEQDSVSGRIARARRPGQDIRIEDFAKSRLPELDAVIGNVPFADVRLEYKGQKLALHDFFIAKSVDALTPGGIMAVVTSHFTLDKQNSAMRESLASTSDFLGAIRLPSDAFKREGTAVVTDIVFMRKRSLDEPPRHVDPNWLGAEPMNIEGTPVTINRFFLNHPEQVLGSYSNKDSLYPGGYSVIGSGDLREQLNQAILRLPELPARSARPSLLASPAFVLPPLEQHVSEGSFFVHDKRIHQIVDGQSVPVIYGGGELWANGAMMGRRMGALIDLRDKARYVLRSQNEGWPKEARTDARKKLNSAYDAFKSAYGPINKTTFSSTNDGTMIRRMPNIVKFKEDPDAMLVMSLEDYNEVTGQAAKAAIMQKDVVGKSPPITSVTSAEEGLLVALNQRGAVDLAFIETLYGKPKDQIISELNDLIFLDPESRIWETADVYLSGNVRAKLGQAEKAGPVYARNAESLRAVQPEDVLPGDIDANLGAPWIPSPDIRAFAAELFSVEPFSITISHLAKDAVWSIEGDYSVEKSVPAATDYGTQRANGIWLLDLALNMKSPVIYDPDPADSDKRVVNQEATLAAREKQKLLKEKFRSWVFTDPDRTERLVRLYNDTYNNLRPRLFDGSHLDFPGMSQAVRLRSHQKDAIWRCMSSGNTLLAHVVGSGKTFTMAASGMKMKQAALRKKPMYVVPNHMLEQFAREFMQLYPNAKLLVASKDDLSRERRKFLTAKIASGEWDGIIVTHSSFERIGMSKGFQQEFLRDQIREYDKLLIESASAKTSKAHRNIMKNLEKQKSKREARLQELLAEDKKDDGVVFDEIGVDHIFIDEAHYFKNLETPTKMERVAGIQTGGSERAFDLFMKARYLDQRHPGNGVTFATGTPISNTMVELYVMSMFLDPAGMRIRGIDHFDGWAATFGEIVETMEISPDGQTLKPRSRFAKFVNLPELQQMFRAFADVQTAEMLNLPRPKLVGGKAHVVVCQMSAEQYAIQQELVARYDRLRSQKVDPRVDNALAITTDGRKLALDARMLDPSASDYPDSKINHAANRIFSRWQRTTPIRGTQLVFCDLGVHPTPWGFCVYDEIIRKLTERGIPRTEIAAIGDADSDAKKQALFEKMRQGTLRVLIGSTTKMGTGMNVQKRLVGQSDLDAPWRPSDVEQRDGRILRQGNLNDEVEIDRYVTEGSFDAYTWQALETKARFIGQVVTGNSAVRRAEDIGGQELSYAEVKAIASGNPAVLTLAEADAELQRLAILKKNHADEQYLARRNLRELPGSIERLTARLTDLTADLATATTNATTRITIGKTLSTRENAVEILEERMDSFPLNVRHAERVPMGIYRGLRFGMVLRPEFTPEVYLEGKTLRQVALSRDHQGPRAVLNALERLANGYQEQCVSVQRELSLAEGQLRDYRSRLGTPFTHDAYLSELTNLRDQLKAALSAGPSEQGTEQVPDASQIAAQIKALKSAYTIEATPERVSKRRSSAEEPVTARIRRRTADGPVVDAATGQELSEPSAAPGPSKKVPYRPEKPAKEGDEWHR
jgi:N12 class adenine-specific DNA methylase